MSSVQSKRIPPLGKADTARFWAFITKAANGRGCWLWGGSRNSKGYGRFYVDGQHYYAHRVSWALAGREVPVDLQIAHDCDTHLCVNPDHLTMADNSIKRRGAKLQRNLAGKRAAIKKPCADFPLFPHATGRWAKKVRGKLCYFGSTVADPNGDAAMDLWLLQKDALLAGRTPRAAGDGLTVHQLCNRFCEAKEQQAEAGDITRRSFLDYHATCKTILASFGKGRLVDDLASDDFEALRASFAKRLNPNTLGNEVQRVRVAFKYAYDAGLIDKPIRFGPTFKRPAKRILRAERQKKGERMFEARHLRRILKAADQPLKAMILLGVNCGFGNHDCGTLPQTALDLKGGWINFPRPKTAIERRCPLWPETVAAVEEAIAQRPAPKSLEHAGLVFITKYGGSWAKETSDNPISNQFRKLLDKLQLHRPGLGFYALRHTFETIAGETRDQVAVNAIMGHADASMAAHYRERISDERLVDAVNVVRRWLFRRDSPEQRPYIR